MVSDRHREHIGCHALKQVFEIDVEVGEESFRYRLEIEHADDGRHSRVAWESLGAGPTMLFKCEMGDVQLYRDDRSAGQTFKTDWTESAGAKADQHETIAADGAVVAACRDDVAAVGTVSARL